MDYLLLIVLWIAWCGLHSLLIAPALTAGLQRRWPRIFRYYRLMYNGFALASLIPVVMVTHTLATEPFLRWAGPLRAPQAIMLVAALWLFRSGAQRYDFKQFLGIRQIRGQTDCGTLTEDCRLDTSGILAVVRHPWYAAGLLLIWARDLDASGLCTNLVLTGYFVVGAALEERKLARLFGADYRRYRQRVAMFFPLRWLCRRLFSESKKNPGR